MKLYLKVFMIIVVLMGGIFMANRYGSCDNSRYTEYFSEDPELNITMDYISGWLFEERRGSYGSYAQVQFYGTVKDGFAPSIIVTVKHSSKVTFKPLTIKAMENDLIRRRMYFEDAKIISRSDIELFGLPAIDLTLSYKQLDKLRSVEANFVPFMERIVIVQKNDRFYTIRYVNPEKEYNVFEKDFLHCIETLRLKD